MNETRRVTYSAAVLEGLDFATHMTDKLGGTVWKGKHLLLDWYDNLCRQYFDQPEILKKPRLVLNKAEITANFSTCWITWKGAIFQPNNLAKRSNHKCANG